jgi:zinc and cadmium transporter
MVWGYSIISVVIVSLLSFLGIITIVLPGRNPNRLIFLLVSFAVGGLFGDAFIHLLPDAFKKIESTTVIAIWVLAGIFVFFILEKVLRWRHSHVADSEPHIHPVVMMNLIGDAVHNLIDGMVIGATYVFSIPLGITTTLAVVLHEIPHELGNFGILIHGGLTVKKALIYNFFSALTAILGTILSLLIGPHLQGYTTALLPITAGGFIYIAGSDLIPELQHELKIGRSILQFALILLGLGIMGALVFLDKA